MTEGREQNVTSLVAEAVRDTTELAGKELALFKTELTENISRLGVGLAMMVVAAVFAITALSLLTEALVNGLLEW